MKEDWKLLKEILGTWEYNQFYSTEELWSKALLRTASNLLNINRRNMDLRRRLPRKKVQKLSPQTRRLVNSIPRLRFPVSSQKWDSEARQFWCDHNPSSFPWLWPVNVLPFKSTTNCKRTYCCNVELLLRSIRNFVSRCTDLSETVRAKMKLLTVFDLQKVILCEKRMGCLMFSKSCMDSDSAR